MVLVEVVFALATALVLTLLFVRLLGWRAGGGFGAGGAVALLALFAALFLGAWVGGAYVVPWGTEAGGLALLPLLALGLLLVMALLLAALLPRVTEEHYETRAVHQREQVATWAAWGCWWSRWCCS